MAILPPLAYVGALSLVFLGTYVAVIVEVGAIDIASGWHLGRDMFAALSIGHLLLVVFLAPAVTVGAFTVEKEQRTLPVLLTTPVRPRQIILGKLLASTAHVTLLVWCSIPVTALCFVLGGLSPIEIILSYLLILVTAFTLAMLGLCVSAHSATSAGATLAAYAIMLTVLGGTAAAELVGPAAHSVRATLYSLPILFCIVTLARGLKPDITGTSALWWRVLLLMLAVGALVAVLRNVGGGSSSTASLNPIAAMVVLTLPDVAGQCNIAQASYAAAIPAFLLIGLALGIDVERVITGHFVSKPYHSLADLRRIDRLGQLDKQ